jgi:hypothetical protein
LQIAREKKWWQRVTKKWGGGSEKVENGSEKVKSVTKKKCYSLQERNKVSVA